VFGFNSCDLIKKIHSNFQRCSTILFHIQLKSDIGYDDNGAGGSGAGGSGAGGSGAGGSGGSVI
jgi:hypothetical protein